MNLFQLLTLSVVTAVLAVEFLGLCRKSAGRKPRLLHRCVVRRGRGDRGSRNPSSHRNSHRHRSGSGPCPLPGRPGVLVGFVLLLLLYRAIGAAAYGSGASPGNAERPAWPAG